MICIATMQIKSLVLSLISGVVSLLPFPDSTCFYCVTVHSLLLWSRIKKKMNEISGQWSRGNVYTLLHNHMVLFVCRPRQARKTSTIRTRTARPGSFYLDLMTTTPSVEVSGNFLVRFAQNVDDLHILGAIWI